MWPHCDPPAKKTSQTSKRVKAKNVGPRDAPLPVAERVRKPILSCLLSSVSPRKNQLPTLRSNPTYQSAKTRAPQIFKDKPRPEKENTKTGKKWTRGGNVHPTLLPMTEVLYIGEGSSHGEISAKKLNLKAQSNHLGRWEMMISRFRFCFLIPPPHLP